MSIFFIFLSSTPAPPIPRHFVFPHIQLGQTRRRYRKDTGRVGKRSTSTLAPRLLCAGVDESLRRRSLRWQVKFSLPKRRNQSPFIRSHFFVKLKTKVFVQSGTWVRFDKIRSRSFCGKSLSVFVTHINSWFSIHSRGSLIIVFV